MEIFKQEYYDEDLSDVDRDVSEAFCSTFNEKVKDLPDDGIYTVTITWRKNDDSKDN